MESHRIIEKEKGKWYGEKLRVINILQAYKYYTLRLFIWQIQVKINGATYIYFILPGAMQAYCPQVDFYLYNTLESTKNGY